ncbi:MAG: hypothetical protein QXU46_05830, partial [Candidatus Bathyarchaeia archaeon]
MRTMLSRFLEKIKKVKEIERILAYKIFWVDLSALIVALMICLYTIFFSCFTILKHYSFRTYAWDLGIFNQAFWFTVKYG